MLVCAELNEWGSRISLHASSSLFRLLGSRGTSPHLVADRHPYLQYESKSNTFEFLPRVEV